MSSTEVGRLLERAVRAGVAPGLIAGWQGPKDERSTIVMSGRSRVSPSSVDLTEETRFDLASLTKPLAVGVLSLLAVREGILSLETRVDAVLSELSDTALGSRTVLQLLTHTSGLPAWEPLYAISRIGGCPLDDVLAELPVGESARHVVYSCPGFITLGRMLEELWVAPLDALFADRVTRPLGLDEVLGFRPSSSQPVAAGALTPGAERILIEERGLDPSLIPPVAARRPDDGNSRFLGDVAGNAGLFGTISGVLALARTHLSSGPLLTVEEIALATTDHTPGLEQARGLAWQLASSPGCSAGPALPSSAFGHTGFTGTSLWLDPTRGVAMALLANRNHPGHRRIDLHPLRRRFHKLVVDQYR